MERFEFPAGAVIFNIGDPAATAFLIQTGTVELLRGSANSLSLLTQVDPGEVFGEMSLIEERPHSLTARAVSAVQLSGLTRAEFEQLLNSDPVTVRVYLNTLFERLRTLSAHGEAGKGLLSSLASDISVTIHPLTRRAAATLPRDGLPIRKFPFRIGRAAGEKEEIPLDLNDLWLNDQTPFSVSRNHASIERAADSIIVKDRGSSLGMFVNETHIGGKTGDRQIALEDGDNIVVIGGRMSPYQFRINVSRD